MPMCGDRAALKTALNAGVEELGGRLDIVIANAGIAPMAGEDALAGRHRRQSHRGSITRSTSGCAR